MTAFLTIRLEDQLLFFSDGVGYDDEGVVQRIGPKVMLRPDLPAIIGSRGSSEFTDILPAFHGWVSFDDLVERIPEDGAHVFSIMKEHRGPDDPPSAQVWLAGWSESAQRFALKLIEFRADGGEALPLTDVDRPCMYQPAPSEEACRKVGFRDGKPTIRSNQGLEAIVQDAVIFMHAQRLTKNVIHHLPDAPHGSMAGGFVQLSIITRSSLSSMIVHRYPDEIGKKIDPEAGVFGFEEVPLD